MNERNNIFTPDNIISSFGIVIDDRFDVEMEYANGSYLISSKLSIKNKDTAADCFVTDNYEYDSKPCIVSLVKTNFNKDGSFTSVLDFNNEKIDTILTVCNRYLQVYKRMYDIKEFNLCDKVELVFLAEYDVVDGLSQTNLVCSKIKYLEAVDDYQGPVETHVQYFVNDFLEPLDIAFIDEHTDMDKLYTLVEMQRTINHMARI